LSEIQSLISQLRPRSALEEGLPLALRRLVDEHHERDGLQVSLEVQGQKALSEAEAVGLYAIAHEALINVAKHSGVCEGIIRLNLDAGGSSLEIEDHGLGFDPQPTLSQRGHLGLATMSERAREIGWSLSIESRRGEGTCIRVMENPSGESQ
jgi:signal transduction histidine kinase